MPTTKAKLPISIMQGIGERFLQLIEPHVMKAHIAGSVRRKCDFVGDCEIVCVAKHRIGQTGLFEQEIYISELDDLFHKNYPGIVSCGSRYKKFRYGVKEFPILKKYGEDQFVQIDLFITSMAEWGRIFAVRTGSATYSEKVIAGGWSRKGWVGTSEGLRRSFECIKTPSGWKVRSDVKEPEMPPQFETEESFFEFIGVDWIEPSKRSWK